MTTEHSNTINPHANGGIVSKSLLSIVLIFIESALTLMLRFDPKLRNWLIRLPNLVQLSAFARIYHISRFMPPLAIEGFIRQ
ncbi:hypothetical protein AABM16_02860 [Moraxella catarrhalis]